jgi:endonuclease/exonuclease/phosphatase family metal-dependent hydrolase
MFTVLTWNVENLFRPKQSATAAERQRYQAMLNHIARLIKAEAPDVVALQEVGGLGPLTDLQRACGGYPHLDISSFPDDRGIRVAILSKAPVLQKGEY